MTKNQQFQERIESILPKCDDEIKQLLYEYKFLLDNVPEVYSSVTGGKINSPTCDPRFIIECVEERLANSYNHGYKHGYSAKFHIGKADELLRGELFVKNEP